MRMDHCALSCRILASSPCYSSNLVLTSSIEGVSGSYLSLCSWETELDISLCKQKGLLWVCKLQKSDFSIELHLI